MSIASNLMAIQHRVREAAESCARSPGDVQLTAVTKTVDLDMVEAAYAAGVRHFGENRVQDLRRKFEQRPGPECTVHLIGPLQTNKVRDAVRYADLIETVDRESLIDAIERRCEFEQKHIEILIQVNVAGEAQKHGCSPEHVDTLLTRINEMPRLVVRGLMTIAPLVDDPEDVRPVFRQLRELRDASQERHPDVHLTELSMGMTNDYWVAIEEGATMIRLGRAIFDGQGVSSP